MTKMNIGEVWYFHYLNSGADDYHLIIRFDQTGRAWGMCLYSSDDEVQVGALNPIVVDEDDEDEMIVRLEDVQQGQIPGWPR